MKRLIAAVVAVAVMTVLFTGCYTEVDPNVNQSGQQQTTDTTLPQKLTTIPEFMDIMQKTVTRVYLLFPKLEADDPLIEAQDVLYEDGQYAAYISCVYTDDAAYQAELQRVRELQQQFADEPDYAMEDAQTVPGAVKISFAFKSSVMAYMFDSGSMSYALFYEADKRIVYVAVSENPLGTYSQLIPPEYFITADVKAVADEKEAQQQ